jgi:hypothetical protein
MQCTYLKSDGSACNANAMKDSQFCFSHNPDTQTEKHIATVKGGENSRSIELNLSPVTLQKPEHVVALLGDTINGVRSGEIPPNVANTVGYLAGHLLKAMEISNLAGRLELVESVLIERKLTAR